MSIRDSLEIVDYNNKDHIKSLLYNYTQLQGLQQRGNITAHCIRIDLDYALSHIPSPTTEILKMYFIHGFTYKELSESFIIGEATVKRHLDKGINEMVELLNATRKRH